MDISKKLQEALDLFVDLTGVSPDKTSWSFGELGVDRMYKIIGEALKLDTTNVTGALMLDAMAQSYFDSKSFSVNSMLTDMDKAMAYMTKVRDFKALIEDTEIKATHADFIDGLRRSLRISAMYNECVEKVLENPTDVAFLRRDALRSVANLRVDQFMTGPVENTSVHPKYHPTVFQFWNVDSLVQMACSMPSGVLLSLVRDPIDYECFFAFCIRNGSNLFVLSDAPQHAHPLQKFMSRRPDRSFGERSARNWFPYGLMNVDFDEESGRLYFDKSQNQSIIPVQQTFDELSPIKDLGASEIIWISMMLQLIVDKFWHKGHQCKELSYTASMIEDRQSLTMRAALAKLDTSGTQLIQLEPLDATKVSGDTEEAYGSDGKRPHAWMLERYRDQLSEVEVSKICPPDIKIYLNPSGRKPWEHYQSKELVPVDDKPVVTTTAQDNALHPWDLNGRTYLSTMPSGAFGTEKALDDDRRFLARANMSVYVQRAANKEFSERKDEILVWWEAALRKNIDFLYSLVVNDEIWLKYDREKFPGVEIHGTLIPDESLCRIMRVVELVGDTKDTWGCLPIGSLSLSQGYDRFYRCDITGARSSYHVIFTPHTADHLAFLAGIPFDELPDVLQFWTADSSYSGNANLDRIDPMAWKLRNPWSSLKFGVRLALSKRGMNRLRKKYNPITPTELIRTTGRGKAMSCSIIKF